MSTKLATTDAHATPMVLALSDRGEAIRAACAARCANAEVVPIDVSALNRLPQAVALVVEERTHARIARAAGFLGGIVVIGLPADAHERAAGVAQGTEFADPAALPGSLAEALDAACALDANGVPRPVDDGVARTRRLFAAGELALELQHAFNNPLTALMTEVQLLELDAPTPAVRESASRMLDLVRRLTGIARTLDSVRDPARVR